MADKLMKKRACPLRAKNGPGPWEYGALAVLLAVCLTFYCYTDLPLIARHSMTLWDVLREGDLFHFYRTATAAPVGLTLGQTGEVPYDIWVYLLLAIWNLPVYLWECLTGNTLEMSFWALLWVRLAALLPFAGACRAVYGIGRQLGRSEGTCLWAAAIFASSLYLLNGTFCLSQIDIFSVFFTLMGFWAYLRGDRKKFILWFIPAITFKVFALMVFLPLLLLWEKRLWYLLRDGLAACSLTLASKLLFLADKLQTPTGFDERRFIRMLWEVRIDFGVTCVSVFAVLFGAVCILCWCAHLTEENRARWAVWALAGGYFAFFIGGAGYPYWAVLLAPVPALLYLLRPAQIKTVLLLDLVSAGAFFARSLYSYPGLYDGFGNQYWMLAGRLTGRRTSELFRTLTGLLDEANRMAAAESLLTAAFWLGGFALLVLFFPRKDAEPEGEAKMERGVFWLRLAANAALVLSPLAMYLVG